MTEETQAPEVQKLSERDATDFKQYYGQVVNGIMSSIPFGVNIDPTMVASVAKNTALAMIEIAADIMPEAPEHQSNFPAPVKITRETLAPLLQALVSQDRGLAVDTLSTFGVASLPKLDSRDVEACYHLIKNRLAR